MKEAFEIVREYFRTWKKTTGFVLCILAIIISLFIFMADFFTCQMKGASLISGTVLTATDAHLTKTENEFMDLTYSFEVRGTAYQHRAKAVPGEYQPGDFVTVCYYTFFPMISRVEVKGTSYGYEAKNSIDFLRMIVNFLAPAGIIIFLLASSTHPRATFLPIDVNKIPRVYHYFELEKNSGAVAEEKLKRLFFYFFVSFCLIELLFSNFVVLGLMPYHGNSFLFSVLILSAVATFVCNYLFGSAGADSLEQISLGKCSMAKVLVLDKKSVAHRGRYSVSVNYFAFYQDEAGKERMAEISQFVFERVFAGKEVYLVQLEQGSMTFDRYGIYVDDNLGISPEEEPLILAMQESIKKSGGDVDEFLDQVRNRKNRG